MVQEDIRPHGGKWLGETWIFQLRLPKARKEYRCQGCSQAIEKGQRHVMYTTANQEGPGMETWRLHGECYLSNQAMFDSEYKRPDRRWS